MIEHLNIMIFLYFLWLGSRFCFRDGRESERDSHSGSDDGPDPRKCRTKVSISDWYWYWGIDLVGAQLSAQRDGNLGEYTWRQVSAPGVRTGKTNRPPRARA